MKSNTEVVLKVMNVLFWIIFIGLMVRAGALLFSMVFTLIASVEGSSKLYSDLNFSSLYGYDKVYYILIMAMLVIIAVMKAYIFYIVIRIFMKIDYMQPFNKEILNLISRIGYVALFMGILSILCAGQVKWLGQNGVAFPDMDKFIGAGSEHILFAGVIVFIAHLFKRGMEIQSENELTV